MRKKTRDNNRSSSRFFSHVAAERKKVVLAMCLVTLMTFMWAKLLMNKSPKSADAKPLAELIEEQNQLEPKEEISFIELPQIEGRNDMVTRDFFTSSGWQEFGNSHGRKSVDVERIDIVAKYDDQEVIKEVAESLKLEAIVSSENPLAFINNKVLRPGDKLLVGEGNESYECEVVEIKENIVVVKCRGSRITLKLTLVN
jgi:hypothetical protein